MPTGDLALLGAMISVYHDLLKCIFINEKVCIFIKISLKCLAEGPIDKKSALVQVMAWHQTGIKPLPEPMFTQFTDTYMRHLGDKLIISFYWFILGTLWPLQNECTYLPWTEILMFLIEFHYSTRNISFIIHSNNSTHTQDLWVFKKE